MRWKILGWTGFLATLASGAAAQTAGTTPSPYLGSITSEPLHPGPMNLSIQDAMRRGLSVNLGLFLSAASSDRAGAARRTAMSDLLPHLEASVGASTRRINPRANGIPLPDLPPTVDVDNADARVTLTQQLVNLAAISRTRAAGASAEAARNDYREARETVALAVSDAYLSVSTAQARLAFAQADLRTADAAYQLAKDREAAGLSPEVDALRARVEQQSRQERVIETRNALARQRIALLRLLGLDIRQSIRLTSHLTDRAVPAPTRDAAHRQALERRYDYRSAGEQLRAAQLSKRAAQRERAPRLGLAADYGALGTTPGNATSTWNVGVVLQLPVFQGGRISAAVDEADATMREQEARLRDMQGRIAQEVDDALLDVDAAHQQVGVSRAAVGYANRALTQSRDRFASGVTNNIELIQAQEALASANEQWVASLAAYDMAQIVLARATGAGEAAVGRLLSEQELPE